MRKQHLFIALIVLGVLGRWILVPSIGRLKAESLKDKQAQKRQSSQSCLELSSCSIYELSSEKLSSGESRKNARTYLLNKWSSFIKENEHLSWRLRGKLVDKQDTLEVIDNQEHLDAFLQGLYLCHVRECLDFFKKHKDYFWKRSYEYSAKLSLKQEGGWTKKSKILKDLLNHYSSQGLHFKAVELIDFIPNHPKLKRYIEYHFLKINNLSHIEKAAIHLSRYSRGWHDRAFKKVLNSKSKAHIENFLKVMRVGCPSRLSLIYNYWDDWDKHTRQIARDQGRYLLKDEPKILKKVSLIDSDIIEGAKCLSGASQF